LDPELIWKFWETKKLLPLPAYEPWAIQSVAYRYKDYGTRQQYCVPAKFITQAGNICMRNRKMMIVSGKVS